MPPRQLMEGGCIHWVRHYVPGPTWWVTVIAIFKVFSLLGRQGCLTTLLLQSGKTEKFQSTPFHIHKCRTFYGTLLGRQSCLTTLLLKPKLSALGVFQWTCFFKPNYWEFFSSQSVQSYRAFVERTGWLRVPIPSSGPLGSYICYSNVDNRGLW